MKELLVIACFFSIACCPLIGQHFWIPQFEGGIVFSGPHQDVKLDPTLYVDHHNPTWSASFGVIYRKNVFQQSDINLGLFVRAFNFFTGTVVYDGPGGRIEQFDRLDHIRPAIQVSLARRLEIDKSTLRLELGTTMNVMSKALFSLSVREIGGPQYYSLVGETYGSTWHPELLASVGLTIPPLRKRKLELGLRGRYNLKSQFKGTQELDSGLNSGTYDYVVSGNSISIYFAILY